MMMSSCPSKRSTLSVSVLLLHSMFTLAVINHIAHLPWVRPDVIACLVRWAT